MHKNNQNNFVGQPILKQFYKFIPKEIISNVINKYKANRYYKKISFQEHVITGIFGVLAGCSGLREIIVGIQGFQGKLKNLGLKKAVPKSTLADANMNRSYLTFENLYYQLLNHYKSFISDSRLKGLSIRNLKIIDSTTIQLFNDILKGVGRNPTTGNKKKGGLKVHSMLDAFSGVVEFVKITEAKMHDRKFLYSLKLVRNSYIVMDKAYNDYNQFLKWTKEKIWFVTRMKTNANYKTTKILLDKSKRKKVKGVIKEEYILMNYKSKDNNKLEQLKLRKITYRTEEEKVYLFISNDFKQSAERIALIYKYRWNIELLFKQIKQNFPIKYFWGNGINAMKIQIFCVLICQLLIIVARKKAQVKKSITSVITFIRIHVLSFINLIAYIKDSLDEWVKKNKEPSLFPI